jgi:hypothetical protein
MERIWQVLDSAPQSFLDEHPELPPIVANLLFHRNIKDQKKIDEFLNQTTLKMFTTPSSFLT